MMVIAHISQETFHSLKRKWAETKQKVDEGKIQGNGRNIMPRMKIGNTSRKILVKFVFKGLSLVSTMVAVVLHSVTTT